jgi:succinate-acetate transporter protein
MQTAALPSPIAGPVPLGRAGVGLSTYRLSPIGAGIVAGGATPAVLPTAALYGGAAQFIAFRAWG